MEKKIIITDHGNLDNEEVCKLEENGYIVVIAKDPSKVRFLSELETNPTNDYLMSALYSMENTGTGGAYFVRELHRRLREKELNKKP